MGFTQGLSGLNAAARDLTTIGNNIANSQTVGYKSGRTEFADMFAGAVGLGTKVADVSRNFTGGPLTSTGRDMDLAINGDGFFRLTQGAQVVYSRNGQFHRTKEGYIANAQGALLTGYNVQNFNGTTGSPFVAASGNPETIRLPTLGLNAKATSDASLVADLDAGADIIPPAATFDPKDSDSFNWTTPYTMYDSLGNAHNVSLYFAKSATNQWNVYGRMTLGEASIWSNTVSATGTYPTGFNPATSATDPNGVPFPVSVGGHDYIAHVSGASGTAGAWTGGTITYVEKLPAPISLTFSASGNLQTVGGGTDSIAEGLSFNAQNGSNPITFDFNFGGTTQTAQDFRASGILQDGYASGDLVDISIEENGMVRGVYSNGESVNLAQLAMARFASTQGLEAMGDNAYAETGASGQPILGLASNGQFGTLLDGTVEGSNVDLSQELVNMIIAQRTYQANAKTITTQSQILQTAVNMA